MKWMEGNGGGELDLGCAGMRLCGRVGLLVREGGEKRFNSSASKSRPLAKSLGSTDNNNNGVFEFSERGVRKEGRKLVGALRGEE